MEEHAHSVAHVAALVKLTKLCRKTARGLDNTIGGGSSRFNYDYLHRLL